MLSLPPCALLGAVLLAPVLLRAQPAPMPAAPPRVLTPSLTIYGEYWGNTAGGLETGARWNSLADLTLELDLAALGARAGSALVAQLFWIENQRHGASLADLTGAANPVSGIQASDAWRVFNLFYRQTWGSERFALKIGQIAIDDDFMGSEYAGLFAYSALGTMPSQVATGHCGTIGGGTAFPIYAVAAPGIHFSATINDEIALQLGLYHGGPGHDGRANHGFSWDTGSGRGFVAFCEGAYTFELAGNPSTLRAGGAFHTGRFDDFDTLALEPDADSVRGHHSFYLVHDLVLAAADEEHPTLGAFWRVGLSPQPDRSVVHLYADAGLNWFAPLPARPDDALGLAVSYNEYGAPYRRLAPDLAAAETAIELTYRARLTRRLALQAFLQRHFNPLPAADGRRHAATVCGCRAELAL